MVRIDRVAHLSLWVVKSPSLISVGCGSQIMITVVVLENLFDRLSLIR